MYEIIIEPWRADAEYVHCHRVGFDGIHAREGSVISNVSVAQVTRLGIVSGFLKKCAGGLMSVYKSEKSMDEFCTMAEEVLHYSEEYLATAQGQIEEALQLDVPFTEDSITVAYLDWWFRERLADDARSVDNPFAEKITLKNEHVAAEINDLLTQTVS